MKRIISKNCPSRIIAVTAIGLTKEENQVLKEKIGRLIRAMNKSTEARVEYFISCNQE